MMDCTQMSFQEYMLQGKGTPVNSAIPSPSNQGSSSTKKRFKSVGPVLKAFQGRIEDWKDVDGQLEAVAGSIANLRDRIWWEMRQSQNMVDEGREKPWLGSGFRLESTALVKEDIDLALRQDLLQHEKMLTASRTLIAALAQAQDRMGRRLDEWMMMQLEEPLTGSCQSLLDEAQEVYVFLAVELHRKQGLIQKLVLSSHDGLVDKEVVQMMSDDENPRTVARRCCNDWKSKAKKKLGLVESLVENHTKF